MLISNYRMARRVSFRKQLKYVDGTDTTYRAKAFMEALAEDDGIKVSDLEQGYKTRGKKLSKRKTCKFFKKEN